MNDQIQTPTSPLSVLPNTQIVNEKTYPVRKIWLLKSSFGTIAGLFGVLIIILIFSRSYPMSILVIYMAIALIFLPFRILIRLLTLNNFHYTLDQKYLIIGQGILSKQQRNIPYGVIQNVLIEQSFFDRIFNLKSVSIENAAQGGMNINQTQLKFFGVFSRKTHKDIGFYGNAVFIPALKPDHGETLKNLILLKMKENPIKEQGL